MTGIVVTQRLPTANGQHIAVLTLSSERTLNALTLAMTQTISQALTAWQDDPTICLVVLQGAGERAFCAGGDVVSLRNAICSGDLAYCDEFFREEYALDLQIHRYAKPILALGHGVVMGGGMGVFVGASHRVVTETSRLAMPEISIGLYPDVGASWFLARMPGRLGLFVGLTGTHLNAADALFSGLADFAIPAHARATLLDELATLPWQADTASNHALLTRYLQQQRHACALPLSPLRGHYDTIQAVTQQPLLPDLVEEIVQTGTQHADPWWQTAAKKLASGAPSSIALTLETRRRARHLSLAETFAMEQIVSQQCCRRSDFAEGVRALLVDKDNAPRWSSPSLAALDPADIAAHFVAPDRLLG